MWGGRPPVAVSSAVGPRRRSTSNSQMLMPDACIRPGDESCAANSTAGPTSTRLRGPRATGTSTRGSCALSCLRPNEPSAIAAPFRPWAREAAVPTMYWCPCTARAEVKLSSGLSFRAFGRSRPFERQHAGPEPVNLCDDQASLTTPSTNRTRRVAGPCLSIAHRVCLVYCPTACCSLDGGSSATGR
jgi:hypothetical protein